MIISKLFHSLKTSGPFSSVPHQHTPTHTPTIHTHTFTHVYTSHSPELPSQRAISLATLQRNRCSQINSCVPLQTYIPCHMYTHTFLIPFVIKERMYSFLSESVPPLFGGSYFPLPSQELLLSEFSNSLKSIPS